MCPGLSGSADWTWWPDIAMPGLTAAGVSGRVVFFGPGSGLIQGVLVF